MISWVAERFDIHPQTLRLYEREGLIRPARSVGNTRLFDEETCDRLQFILTLTRDLGVNLAGVEVVLNMKDQIDTLQEEILRLASLIERENARRSMVPREHALAMRGQSGLVPSEEE
jgi:MerR family transcriptional regulator/heat shock protein HspR